MSDAAARTFIWACAFALFMQMLFVFSVGDLVEVLAFTFVILSVGALAAFFAP